MLDVQTLFVALSAAFLMFGLTLAVSRRSLRDRPELALWAWGTWAMVAAFALLTLRMVGPEWLSVVGGNWLMFVGIYLNSRALHRFVLHRPPPPWQLGLALAGMVGVLLVLEQPLYVRTSLVSTVLALQGLPMVLLVARRGWHAEPSLRTVAVALALGVTSLAARAVHAPMSPADYQNFWAPSWGNGITYLAAYLFPLGAGIGFTLANLERTADQLREQATTDALTGCLRRGVFDVLRDKCCEHAKRAGEPLSLVLLDLDHFKSINDTHGHHAGDRVLAQVAQAVRGRLRAADLFARMGGEEFALLLPDTDTAGAHQLAEALRHAIAELRIEVGEGRRVQVTASAGVSAYTAREPSPATAMFRRADQALYAAKHAGRNQVRLAVDASAG